MSSAPPSISEQLVLLHRLLRGAQIGRYVNLSAWMLLVWDHCKFSATDAADSIQPLTRPSAPVISLEQEVRIANANYHTD
jgi:hypothetical protein